MSSREQVLAYSEGDFSIGEKKLVEFIDQFLRKNRITLSSNDLIVDLGCGPGNITEKLALKWPEVNVLGVDGSEEMIARAKRNKNCHRFNKALSRNLAYLCADIKKLQLSDISSSKNIALLVSNSLIHHIINIKDFLDCIKRLSSNKTINFHKDLRRPVTKKIALELKEQCSKEYNQILTNDYYASLKASYTKDELKNFLIKEESYALNVLEEDNKYLMVYGRL